MGEEAGSSSRAIDSSNLGFQLLKKCGWKEGTGFGVSEQGRLEPLQTHIKKNKRGLGAEKIKQNIMQHREDPTFMEQNEQNRPQSKKKVKTLSKRMKKVQEEEKRMQEKEFEQAFFREFWPDNV